MEDLLDVIKVNAKSDFTLELEFENGEQRIFDMKQYLRKKTYHCLTSFGLFGCASIDYGTVVWPGNIDIAPETLYDASVPIELVK